ncbi:MAG: EAL domain-containing protein [Pseudomonadales bacterium]|nr:EAL domain-containing protein [Pseudomonadales bacterium]
MESSGTAYVRATVRSNVIVLITLALLILALRLFPAGAFGALTGTGQYLPLHMLLETLAIIVASMIFVLGWYTQRGAKTLRMQVIACFFLAVAILDFSHMISFAGMPDFVTPSGPEKAIIFWLFARLFAALALLASVILPDRKLIRRHTLLASIFVSMAAIHYLVLIAHEHLPATFDTETGLTSFKIFAEYSLILLYSLAATLLWARALRDGQKDTLALSMSAAIMAMSELLFTFYVDVTDTFNLVGHIYKFLAYTYLYQALVVKGITTPFFELRELSGRLQATLDAVPDMMFELSTDGIIKAYHSRLGLPRLLESPDIFIGQNFRLFITEVEAIKVIEQAMADIFNTGSTAGRAYSLMLQGRQYWYELTGTLLEAPRDRRCLILIRDVTSKYESEQELRIAATAFSSQEGIIITDAQQNILRVNAAFEETSGYSLQEVVGRTPSILSSGKHNKAFFEAMWESIHRDGSWHGEIWNKRKNGEVFPQSVTISAVKNAAGITTHYVGDMVDISRIRDAEATINRLSLFDPLTGLPNRTNIQAQLNEILASSHSDQYFGALLMIDLDDFKDINDTLGHAAGDQLLVQVAQRLQKTLQNGEVAARYGGDEFIVVLPHLSQDKSNAAGKVQAMAQTLFKALEGEYHLDTQVHYTTCSIGISLFDGARIEFSELLQQADIALTQAKITSRTNISFFDPSWQEEITARANLNSDLREALKAHQFELYYQPQWDETRHIVGAEALVRWKHPHRGLIGPDEFIPFAEESGWILALGDEILQMGLQQLNSWQADPKLGQLALSINLSAEQLFESNFIETVKEEIHSRSLDARYLVLELTESTLISNLQLAKSTIEKLSQLGVRFAIDDFGTGYSSLSYLSQLPIDQLKIDQSFVRNIGIAEQDTAIVSTIITMARTLHMEVLAEGVESDAQHSYLLEQGCHLFQGFLFARPLPLQEFEALVRTTQS